MDILHNAIKMLDEVDFGNVGEEKDELITAKAGNKTAVFEKTKQVIAAMINEADRYFSGYN